MSVYEITRISNYDEKEQRITGSKNGYFNELYCNNIFYENHLAEALIKKVYNFDVSTNDLSATYNILNSAVDNIFIPNNMTQDNSLFKFSYSIQGSGPQSLRHEIQLQLGNNLNIYPVNDKPTTVLSMTGPYALNVCFTVYFSDVGILSNDRFAIVDCVITGVNASNNIKIVTGAIVQPDSLRGLYYNIAHTISQTTAATYSFKRGCVVVEKLQ